MASNDIVVSEGCPSSDTCISKGQLRPQVYYYHFDSGRKSNIYNKPGQLFSLLTPSAFPFCVCTADLKRISSSNLRFAANKSATNAMSRV